MKYCIAIISIGFSLVAAMARPMPIGARKYVIPESKAEKVTIVSETDTVKGLYMRDPIGDSTHINKATKDRPRRNDQDRKPVAIVHTEKAFKPLSIEGRVLEPRVAFEREYLDLSQIEAMAEPRFAERLMESLDALE